MSLAVVDVRPASTPTRTTTPAPAPPPAGRRLLPALVSVVLVALATTALIVGPGAFDRVLGADGPPAGIGTEDGYVDGLLSPEATGQPALDRLDPALLAAVRDAATAAAAEGVGLGVNSGWRSTSYQQALLDEAIDRYGSRAEALRWVATPQESRHTTGAAVDVGPAAAASWLDEHGSAYGLCRVFGNEPWHFELVTTPGNACPGLVGDATS